MIRCRFFAGFGWEYGILQEWVPHHDALMTLVRLHRDFPTILIGSCKGDLKKHTGM
jgi:hypothetical protein